MQQACRPTSFGLAHNLFGDTCWRPSPAPVGYPAGTEQKVVRCRVTSPLTEAMTALADALAKRPAQEILFDWFRSGRLVGELSVLIKRRHPEVQARIDLVYQEHLAQLGEKRHDPATQDD